MEITITYLGKGRSIIARVNVERRLIARAGGRRRFLESDDFSFGLTGDSRNYGYHYVDEPGKDTADVERWKIAPTGM
ncbi:hypothetical protein ACNKHU_07980 [Shigella flexneri]